MTIYFPCERVRQDLVCWIPAISRIRHLAGQIHNGVVDLARYFFPVAPENGGLGPDGPLGGHPYGQDLLTSGEVAVGVGL